MCAASDELMLALQDRRVGLRFHEQWVPMSKFVRTRDLRRFAPASLWAAALCAATAAQAGNIVQNGSFETLAGPFVNTTFNYMHLGNGSTFIDGWTVSTSTGPIVLAQSPTSDGYFASDGNYFIDVSGLSDESHDGAVSQTISTTAGAAYLFSMDLANINDGMVYASVGGNLLSLSAGSSFTVGTTAWTTWSAAFTGDALNQAPVLTIGVGNPGSQLDFIDNVSIVRTDVGGVPEPATWALMILGLGGAGATLRRRRAALA